MTGRISLTSPVYSPTASRGTVVLSTISSIHWRTATVLVVRMSVLGLERRHDRHAHHRLAGAAGQHDDPAAAARPAAGVEDVRGLALVVPQPEGLTAGRNRLAQLELKGRARHVAGQVVHRVAQAQQRLLQEPRVPPAPR